MEETSSLVCHQCHSDQPIGYKFCGNCGAKNLALFKKELKLDVEYQENFRMLTIYSAVVVCALILNFLIEDSLFSIVFTSIGFAVIDIIFAVQQPKVWGLITKKVSLLPFLWIIPTFIATGFIISFSIDHLNFVLFGYSFDSGYIDFFYNTEYPLLYSLVIVAVFPAIFEELAFRGFVFNNLKRINGVNSAIWASSFLFALVHFSLISLFWIFPFGLILAYMRNKYSTLIYGVVAHFIHNGTVTVIEYYYGSWVY